MSLDFMPREGWKLLGKSWKKRLGKNDFEEIIDEIWDELDEEDLEEAEKYRTEISQQVLQLLLDAYN